MEERNKQAQSHQNLWGKLREFYFFSQQKFLESWILKSWHVRYHEITVCHFVKRRYSAEELALLLTGRNNTRMSLGVVRGYALHLRGLSLVSAALSAKMRPAAQSPASSGFRRPEETWGPHSHQLLTIHPKSALLWVIHYTSVPVFTRWMGMLEKQMKGDIGSLVCKPSTWNSSFHIGDLLEWMKWLNEWQQKYLVMEPVLQIVVGEMSHVHTELMCAKVR